MTDRLLTPAEYEDRKRRLAADAEDARKALINARERYYGLREELSHLRIAWREQQRGTTIRPSTN